MNTTITTVINATSTTGHSVLVTELSLSLIAVMVIGSACLIIGMLVHGIAKAAGAKPSQLRSIRDVIFVIGSIVAIMTVLSLTGLSSEFTTLTFGGILGLVISLAMQSTLTNVISGIMLIHDRAVKVGDIIQTGTIKGTVIQVGFRTTWLKQDDGSVVIISNSILCAAPLINYTRKEITNVVN
jgi:small-conductance mechanosensitive channel